MKYKYFVRAFFNVLQLWKDDYQLDWEAIPDKKIIIFLSLFYEWLDFAEISDRIERE